MRPSVSVLLSWQPAQLATSGHDLVRRSADLQRQAGDLTSIGSGLSTVWSGAAAQAATAHHTRRSAEVDEFATVVHTAGQALLRAAEAIGQARTSLQSALAAAAAAGCTVLDDGTVLPPARPPVPAGLTDEDRTAWQAQAEATAAVQAAGAARLAMQLRAALTAAGAADDTSAAALSALQPPKVSPAPQPVAMGLTGGHWGPMALPSCPGTPAAAPAPPPEDEDEGGFWSDLGHGVLDVVGLVPVLGEPADGVNAVWYEAEGDHVNAALSAAGMLPVVGMGATAAKVGIKGAKAADEAAAATKSAADARSAAKPPTTGNRFGELEPSTTYTSNGASFRTDHLGRTEDVAIRRLRKEAGVRDSSATREVGRMGQAGDQGGHLHGVRFNGSSEGYNLVPQNGNLNMGAWKAMENKWDAALQEGKEVSVHIRNRYDGDGLRPSRFDVQWTVDGRTFTERFINAPGGRAAP